MRSANALRWCSAASCMSVRRWVFRLLDDIWLGAGGAAATIARTNRQTEMPPVACVPWLCVCVRSKLGHKRLPTPCVATSMLLPKDLSHTSLRPQDWPGFESCRSRM